MYYNLKALILNTRLVSEADKLVVAYTDKFGKITAVAPGAKKILAKLSPATEPVTESELTIYQTSKYSRPTITGAKILNNNTAVKQDFNRNMLALYVGEIVEKFVAVNMPNIRKYELISRTWQLLATAQNPLRVLTAFSLRLLKLSGYSMVDYLKRNYSSIQKSDILYLKTIANCSGDSLDTLEELADSDDKIMWGYVESYLKTYIQQPAVGIFLKKINYIN